MALKVKAKEKLQKIGKYADSYRYVMMPELYSTLQGHQGSRSAQWCQPGRDAGLLGCRWRGDQGLGHRGSLCCAPRFGNHALRSACQELREC